MDPDNLYYATYAKGFRSGRRKQPDSVCGVPDRFRELRHPRPTRSDVQLRLGQELRGGREEQFQQPRAPREQHLLHPMEQHPAADRAAGVPDLLHREYRTGGGEGRGYPGGHLVDQRPEPGARCRVYRRALHPGLPLQQHGAQPLPAGRQRGFHRRVRAARPAAGSRTAPFTAAAGVEYHFTAFAHESFVRVDGEYEARAKWATAGQDPGTSQFDSANFTLPRTTFVSLRGGMQFGAWSLAPFVDNLTNTHALTDYNYTICSNPARRPVAGQPMPRGKPPAARLHVPAADHRHHGDIPSVDRAPVQGVARSVVRGAAPRPSAASARTTSRRVACTSASGGVAGARDFRLRVNGARCGSSGGAPIALGEPVQHRGELRIRERRVRRARDAQHVVAPLGRAHEARQRAGERRTFPAPCASAMTAHAVEHVVLAGCARGQQRRSASCQRNVGRRIARIPGRRSCGARAPPHLTMRAFGQFQRSWV